MCHFITAIIPESANLARVKGIFEEHKVGFKQIQNPSVLAHVAPRDIYVLTTRAWCDCGTPLGSLSATPSRDSVDEERTLSKFRKQGWSDTKIERWLQQKELDAAKNEREQKTHAESAALRVANWVAFLSAVLRSGHTPSIGLLLHWYKRTVQTERFNTLRQEHVSLQDLNTDHLLHINEDVVYFYTP